MKKNNYLEEFETVEDCIHLHACRKTQKTCKGKQGRGCNSKCFAYFSLNYLKENLTNIRSIAIRNGDEYDSDISAGFYSIENIADEMICEIQTL